MNSLFIRWAIMSVAVWVATWLVPGIKCEHGGSVIFAGLVLGVLNTLVKPLLLLLSLPLVIVSFGLFVWLINALLLMLTARIVSGFQVAGFWPAVWASLIISLVSMLLGRTGWRRGRRRTVTYTSETRDDSRRSPPPGKGPIIDV